MTLPAITAAGMQQRIARTQPIIGTSDGNSLPALSGLVNEIADHVADVQAPALQPTRRAIIRGQGSKSTTVLVSGVGEGTATVELPVYTAYSTTMVGVAGGPQIGDDVLITSHGSNNELVMLRANY